MLIWLIQHLIHKHFTQTKTNICSLKQVAKLFTLMHKTEC